MTPHEIKFERLCDKIRKDGDTQHGPSMEDVEQVLKMASMLMRLIGSLEKVASAMESFNDCCDEVQTELNGGIK